MHTYAMKRMQYFSGNRPEIVPFIPDDITTLLDIGCGCGGFGNALKAARGVEVWGVEPEPKAAVFAHQALDKVVEGFFSESADVPDNYFDVITFLDSLEHFPDPYPPLALSKRKLKAGGHIVCSIPNVRYIENLKHLLIDMDWQYEENGIRDHTHLRFFTKKSIASTFEIAGYKILSITGIKPHYWSGKKFFLLDLLCKKWVEDMRYLQFVVVAQPK